MSERRTEGQSGNGRKKHTAADINWSLVIALSAVIGGLAAISFFIWLKLMFAAEAFIKMMGGFL